LRLPSLFFLFNIVNELLCLATIVHPLTHLNLLRSETYLRNSISNPRTFLPNLTLPLYSFILYVCSAGCKDIHLFINSKLIR
jgi:hypothetical protein